VVPLIQGVPPGPDLNPGNIGVFANDTVGPGLFDQMWFFQLTFPSNLGGAVHGIGISGLNAGLVGSGQRYKLPNPFSLTSLPAGPYMLLIAGETLGAFGYYAGEFLVTAAALLVPPPIPLP
jgi:hypothetical protein